MVFLFTTSLIRSSIHTYYHIKINSVCIIISLRLFPTSYFRSDACQSYNSFQVILLWNTGQIWIWFHFHDFRYLIKENELFLRIYNLKCNQTNVILNLAFENVGHLRGHLWLYYTSIFLLWISAPGDGRLFWIKHAY